MPAEYWVDMKRIFVLVADKNMEFLMKGLLQRIPDIEQTKKFEFQISVHPYRDPGIYNTADDFLRPFTEKYDFALVLLDYQGCGQEEKSPDEVENDIAEKLSKSGWHQRSSVIVIKPELENWIWVNERRIQEAISWELETGIYEWLHNNKLKEKEAAKPVHPKEAFEAALKICNTPRSSSVYYQISSKSSYRECRDISFKKMINQLKIWLS